MKELISKLFYLVFSSQRAAAMGEVRFGRRPLPGGSHPAAFVSPFSLLPAAMQISNALCREDHRRSSGGSASTLYRSRGASGRPARRNTPVGDRAFSARTEPLLTERQKQEIREAFDVFDEKHSGRIEVQELKV